MDTKTIAAGQFKQHCLAILDEVEDRGMEVVITKRGRPVARVVPIAPREEREAAVLARLRGQCHLLVSEEELLRPVDDAGWEVE